MDANKRAEDFFARLILEEDSEIRNGCIYLIARVIHEGMEHQKEIDAKIAQKWGALDAAKAIITQTESPPPRPKGILSRMFFWR